MSGKGTQRRVRVSVNENNKSAVGIPRHARPCVLKVCHGQMNTGIRSANVYLTDPIAGEMAAIANCEDPRVQQIFADIPVLAELVKRF